MNEHRLLLQEFCDTLYIPMGVGDKVLDEGWIEGSFLLHQLSPSCVYTVYKSGRVCHKKGQSTSQKSSFWVRYAVGEQPIRWRKSQLNELRLSKPRATQISVTELAKEKPNCLKGSVYSKIGEKDEDGGINRKIAI